MTEIDVSTFASHYPYNYRALMATEYMGFLVEKNLFHHKTISGYTNNLRYLDDIIKLLGQPAELFTEYIDEKVSATALKKGMLWRNTLGSNCVVVLEAGGYNGRWNLYVSAISAEAVTDVFDKILALIPAYEKVKESDKVTIGFWMKTGMGVIVTNRSLRISEWSTIENNYTDEVTEAMADLMALGPDDLRENGRLILLYGPAGTGKTHAIRSLTKKWNEWCDACYILDPSQFLHDPSYMLHAVMSCLPESNERDENGESVDQPWNPGLIEPVKQDRWKLFIIEDANELISAGARETAGQALSQLLNLTDGLVGQGSNILFLITTNEPIDKLHEAVSRPGRAIARINFDLLSVEKANEWLKNKGVNDEVAGKTSLATVYSTFKKSKQINTDKKANGNKRKMGF
jgi:hypothetical protein